MSKAFEAFLGQRDELSRDDRKIFISQWRSMDAFQHCRIINQSVHKVLLVLTHPSKPTQQQLSQIFALLNKILSLPLVLAQVMNTQYCAKLAYIKQLFLLKQIKQRTLQMEINVVLERTQHELDKYSEQGVNDLRKLQGQFNQEYSSDEGDYYTPRRRNDTPTHVQTYSRLQSEPRLKIFQSKYKNVDEKIRQMSNQLNWSSQNQTKSLARQQQQILNEIRGMPSLNIRQKKSYIDR